MTKPCTFSKKNIKKNKKFDFFLTIIIFIIYTTKQQSRIQRDSLVQALLYNNININMFGVVRTNDGIIDETF